MFSTLKQLLSSIVDYAGLFPPAQLSLPEAMATYDRAQSSPEQWLVGRFVLPVACLPAFVTLLPTVREPAHSNKLWSLSVILSPNWVAELEQIRQHAVSEQILISAIEVPPLPLNELLQLCPHLPEDGTTFVEIPFGAALEPYLTILQQPCVAAKLRTGGITSDAFPDSAQLAQRILSLAQAQIPFKATAGLHHPLRDNHHLTSKPGSASTTMHGFLNVALMAAFAYQQMLTFDEAVALLEEKSIDQFAFTETFIRWRDYSLSLPELASSRQQCFHSFGSCSFQEPIDDLHSLRLL